MASNTVSFKLVVDPLVFDLVDGIEALSNLVPSNLYDEKKEALERIAKVFEGMVKS
jgi:hypothetical protein